MLIDFQQLAPKEAYLHMTRVIVPRPIAWVLSDNGDDAYNLAPFSFFNGVTSRPPILSISIGRKRDGTPKDTWRNIAQRHHFVVHIASSGMAGQVSDTAATLDFGESELERFSLDTVSEEGWTLPRLRHAKVAYYCRRHRIVEVGEGPQGLVLGEIRKAYVEDSLADVADPAGIDPHKLDPLARLGGNAYASLGGIFEVERPA